MKTAFYAGLLMVLPAAVFVSVANAATYVGVSGQCYDDDDNANPSGGEDEISVSDSGPEAGLGALPGEHGITDALSKFALGTVEDNGQPGQACDNYDCYSTPSACSGHDARYDYLAAHAESGSILVEACYRGTVVADGSCPEHPTGPDQSQN